MDSHPEIPFKVPEIILKPGEFILVDLPDPNIKLIGAPDRDQKITYQPVIGPIKFEEYGLKQLVDRWTASPELVKRISDAAERMPFLLAVDSVVNHPEEDNLDNYRLSSDGIPVEMVGIVAKPQTGKTRLLMELMRQGNVDGTTNNIIVTDLDDMSPESLSKTMDWVNQQIAVGQIDLSQPLDFFDKIDKHVAELAKGPRQVSEKPNLRDILAKYRQKYQNIKTDYRPCNKFDEDGQVSRKKIIFVDLPGLESDGSKITDRRPRDIFDLLKFSMPCVELFKGGDHLHVWEQILQKSLVDRDLSNSIINWEIIMENFRRHTLGQPKFIDESEIINVVSGWNLQLGKVTIADLIGS